MICEVVLNFLLKQTNLAQDFQSGASGAVTEVSGFSEPYVGSLNTT